MSNEDAIMELIKYSNMDEWDKRQLIKALAKPPTYHAPAVNVEVEKYKIDQMLKAGLIQEQSEMRQHRNFVVQSLMSKKFAPVYISTLCFLLMLFNSKNFWAWMMAKMGN